MTTDALVEPIEVGPEPEPTSDRRRVRPFHWVALVIGVLLLGGAVAFTLQATSDRDTATTTRVRAQQRLRTQRLATTDAKDELLSTRTTMRRGSETVTQLLDSAGQLASLADQSTGAARNTQSLGAADPPASVDDYNAAVHHANEIAAQYNAMLETIAKQIDDIVNKLGGQVA